MLLGIALPLSANAKAYLSSANIIARANAQKVISLKNLCMNELYDVHGEKNIHRAIGEVPEEVYSLFLNQDRLQWVLYVEDKKKQRLLIKLYEALSNADRVEDAMQLTIDGFTFSFKCYSQLSTESVEMWLDGLSRMSYGVRYKYRRAERGITTSSLHWEEWTETSEDHTEILHKIMDEIGWDHSDAYVLIVVLFSHMNGRTAEGKDVMKCADFVYRQGATSFHMIPAWYKDFISKHFGL